MNRRLAAGGIVLALAAAGVAWVLWPETHTRRVRPRQPKAQAEPAPESAQLRPPVPAGTPNLVVVVGCTVRRDQTAPYGGPPDVTPFLAELAAAGTVFEDALATSSWTREAVVGLITGHHAASWNLPDPGRGQSRRVLADEAHTLAERLHEAGFVTLGVTANPNLNDEYGLAQGFDDYRDTATTSGFAQAQRMSGPEAVGLARTMLEGRSDADRERPFFLQLVVIDTHTPRHVRPDELARFAGEGVPDLVAEYRATLRRTDDTVRGLDHVLRKLGHGEHDTVWVFVADHGEGLSAPTHHRGGHGKSMYPTTVSIPWIVRGPGVPAGARVPGLVSGVDLVPTVLPLLGLPVPDDVVGVDWSTRLRGDPRPTDRERAWSLSMFHGANVAAVWTRQHQCQQDYGTVGVSEFPMLTGCFDRASDPDFTTPIEAPALMTELEEWRGQRLADGAQFVPVDAGEAPGVGRQLELLGYADGDP